MQLDFGPIHLEQHAAYQEKLSQCSQIASDYSFINLWGWGPEYGLQWAWHADLVWIRQTIPSPALWAPVGRWDTADWITLMPGIRKIAQRVIRIPEPLIHLWQKKFGPDLNVSESRGQWDYLYSKQDLVELKGNRYHKKKNLVSQFEKKYESAFLPFGPELIDKALAMQEDWCTWRDCESNDTLAAENKAIERIIKNWTVLRGITGGAICVDETLVAYTIAEKMTDQTLVIHFEKGNPDYKGSYQAINQMFLQHSSGDFHMVNREQDLDDEGLRKAKLSYLPVDFIRKYEIDFPKQGPA